MNDRSECAALRAVMGAHTEDVAVSSTKSCMGHLIAAAGAVEAGICALAIRDGIAPINANHSKADPDCNVNLRAGPIASDADSRGPLELARLRWFQQLLAFRHPEETEKETS